MVHNGVSVRRDLIEDPVEDAGCDEGVDIADAETAGRLILASLTAK